MIAREPVGIDPALVRLTLQALSEEYGRLAAGARSGGDKQAVMERWARACLRELQGVDTPDAEQQRALYALVLEGKWS